MGLEATAKKDVDYFDSTTGKNEKVSLELKDAMLIEEIRLLNKLIRRRK